MSYGKKYYLNFSDYSGNTYVVNLNKKNYSGTTSQINKYPVSPVIHTYRGGRDSLNSVISGSEVNLNFYVTEADNNKYDELFESDYKDWQLEIFKTGLISDGYGYDSTVQSINLTENDSNGGKLWSQTNTPNDNIIYGLNLTSTGNSYTLRWTNPSFNFTPLSFKILIKTDSEFNPFEPDISVNGSAVTSYTWSNIGEYPGPYAFAVAPCGSAGGVNPREFSSTLFEDITNMNVPYNISATTVGNSIVITWINAPYSITVQSFAINRLRLVGGLWVDGTLLTFNNDGTATGYTDTNIGSAHTDAIYKYQIAVAELPDGFDRQTFSEYSNSCYIYNTNINPNFSLNTAMNATVYYGASRIQPVLTVSGGTGTLDVDYNWDIGGSNHDETESVTANGTTFNQNLSYRYTVRGDGFNISLQANPSIYSLYGTTGRTYTSPSVSGSGKVEGISVSQIGANVHLSWTAYVDSSASVKYGYVISKYPTSDFSSLTRIIVSGTGTTSYIDGSPASGNYTYFIQAISTVDAFSQPDPSYYLSPNYPDFFPITIT